MIDSRDKRFSLMGYDLVGGHVWPTPDGTVDTADRIQWLGKYPGIAFTATAAVTARARIFRRRERRLDG